MYTLPLDPCVCVDYASGEVFSLPLIVLLLEIAVLLLQSLKEQAESVSACF